METLISLLPSILVISSILLIIGILLQQSDESLGGAFGGSDNVDTTKKTRRGSDKFLFQATITIAIIFVVSALALVFLR